ncbi:MAG: bifunctional DNA primase/polymerase, partial [Rhodobacteraceae bacterium]|nr:bifunctional DNA primase/polymerase [Paracoccaceae bacterium]
MAPEDQAPPNNQQDQQAAGGGCAGVGVVTYAEAAERLLDNGYEPLPIRPGTKRPPILQWTTLPIDAAQIARWIRQYPDHGVGLRTGRLVAVDIDVEDPDIAHAAGRLVQARFGATLMRVGRWPKRLFLYRAATPFPGFSVHKCDLLALGQQLVGFGIHPDTGKPYHWPLGDTPLDVALEDLPAVDEGACRGLLAELAQLHPGPEPRARKARKGGQGPGAPSQTRDGFGRVTDGRDGWLSAIAFHAVHDALDASDPLDAAAIADVAWSRFEETTNLERQKQDEQERYGPEDAARKVADKLRLLRDGRLPSRAQEQVEAPDMPAAHPAEEARAKLDAVLADACARVEDWHAGKALGAAPQIGVKATVGLGKSSAARRRLIPLRQRLETAGAPSRLLILTPSLALADETADAWREAGERVAVLRGYQAKHRTLRRPMCANLPAVQAAMEAGEDVQTTACLSASGDRCARLEGCLKQTNRTEVAEADVIIAAYDALFTGFAIQPDSIGLIVIDEGCWQRAHEALAGLAVETFAYEHLSVQTRSRKPEGFDAAADLHALRVRAAAAFEASGEGPLR